jgi:RNA polymerase sigma-70 factor (ECF subfamily)
MERADERDWLKRAQGGDETAFAELVKCHQTAVFNVAYRLLGRRRDAEDAAQEAFLRAFQALERFDVARPFAPWIKRITVNVCYNWLESARVKPAVLAADMVRDDEPADLDDWAQSAPTPEQTVATKERDEQVRAAIWQLPPRYRAVIELRHFQELSYEEMAVMLARPLSDVKSDLFRARKQLAKLLQGQI